MAGQDVRDKPQYHKQRKIEEYFFGREKFGSKGDDETPRNSKKGRTSFSISTYIFIPGMLKIFTHSYKRQYMSAIAT
jgi:hypothetical protein